MRSNGFICLGIILMSFAGTTPCRSQADMFVTDKPSPLKLISKELAPTMQFEGSVQLSGRFLVLRRQHAKRAPVLQVLFYPDDSSAGLLPRLSTDRPIKELLISNSDKATAMLFDSGTIKKILTKELLSATVGAMVTIRDYRLVVECDQRWYLAELVSASLMQKVAAGGPENVRVGCG